MVSVRDPRVSEVAKSCARFKCQLRRLGWKPTVLVDPVYGWVVCVFAASDQRDRFAETVLKELEHAETGMCLVYGAVDRIPDDQCAQVRADDLDRITDWLRQQPRPDGLP